MSGRRTWHVADGFTTRTLVVVTHLGSSRNQGQPHGAAVDQHLEEGQGGDVRCLGGVREGDVAAGPAGPGGAN